MEVDKAPVTAVSEIRPFVCREPRIGHITLLRGKSESYTQRSFVRSPGASGTLIHDSRK